MGLDAPKKGHFKEEHDQNVKDLLDLTHTVFGHLLPVLTELKEFEMGPLNRFCDVYAPQPNAGGLLEYPAEKRDKPDQIVQHDPLTKKGVVLGLSTKRKIMIDTELTRKKLSRDHTVNMSGLTWINTNEEKLHLFLSQVQFTVSFVARDVTVSVAVKTSSYRHSTYHLYYYYLTMLTALKPPWRKGCSFQALDPVSACTFSFKLNEDVDGLPIYFALQSTVVGKAYIPFAVYAVRDKIKVFSCPYSNLYATVYLGTSKRV
uniref:DDE_Tnp_1_7 domain-containing protein n=2 Tax=Bursaphelenchus xylophilus TaxID=6326 RepID=A0A1I7RKW1_BURXY